MNKYTIVYGFNENVKFDNNVILIEPRKKFMDIIHKNKKEKMIFIPKILMGSNVSRQVILYALDDKYSVLERPSNAITSREEVYTTSLSNIIKTHDIKEISQFVINIQIDNIKDVLDNIVLYNKIVKKIFTSYDYINSNLLNYFNIIQGDEIYKMVYEHKNINIKNPNICLFPCHKITFENDHNDHNDDKNYKNDKNYNDDKNYKNYKNYKNDKNYKNFFNFIKMYNIDILIGGGKLINDTCMCCIKNVRRDDEKEIYENLMQNLNLIFLNECIKINNKSLDIIIQFNPMYLIMQDTFEINYPIENDILYVYKQHDIIYGNKDTMYNLYNVLKSDEFKKYIKEKQILRGKLYKFFSKNYFYDYISKIFNLILK